MFHSELETVQTNLEESRNETAYFESLVQRYEQRVFDLEELEVELREKLALLEGAVQFAVWWNTVLMNQVSLLFLSNFCSLFLHSNYLFHFNLSNVLCDYQLKKHSVSKIVMTFYCLD